jgi:hypothetical protein
MRFWDTGSSCRRPDKQHKSLSNHARTASTKQCTTTTLGSTPSDVTRRRLRLGAPNDVLESRPEFLAAEGAVLERVAGVLLDIDHEHGRRHDEDFGGHGEPALGPAALLGTLEPHAAGAALGHAHPPTAAGRHPLEAGDDAARRLLRREPNAALPRASRRVPLEERREVEPSGEGNQVERVQRLRLVLVVVLGRVGWLIIGRDRLRDGLLAEPRRLDELGDGDAGVGVGVEQPGDEPARVSGEPRRAAVVPAAHLLKHGRDVVVGERERAGEEDVEDDAAGPDVRLGAVVALVPEHLGRGVPRRAAERVEEAVRARVVGERAEPEVHHLEVARVVDEQVLRLEVAVEHAPRVAEVDGGDELPEVAARDVLLHAPRAHDPREELPAADQLQREVDLGARGHHLVELDDVGVGDALHDGDLPLDLLHHPRADHLVPGQHLDRHGAAGLQVPRRVDAAEVAAAQHAAQLVPPLQHPLLAHRLRPTGGVRWIAASLHDSNQQKTTRVSSMLSYDDEDERIGSISLPVLDVLAVAGAAAAQLALAGDVSG